MDALRPLCLTWLPTRRCNLRCNYCGALRRMPEYGPEGCRRVVEAIEAAFPDLPFWCLLGGDVTVWGEELIPFVKFMSDKRLFYGITSNSVWLNEDRADRLMQAGLTNWTVSCDSLADLQGGRGQKAVAARKAIEMFRARGLKDITCTVSISPDTVEGIPALAAWLSERGVWAEITPVIYGKNRSYDYAPPGPSPLLSFTEADLPRIRKMVKEVVRLRDSGALIHTMKEYLLEWPDRCIAQDWKCRAPWNLVVDADGCLKPCLHLFGQRTREFTVWNIQSRGWDAFLEAWKVDVEEMCAGCYWDCQFEPEYIWQRTKSLPLVKGYFDHGAQAFVLPAEKDATIAAR